MDLTWTISVATLANITDYQVGTATVSGGPYTFESVGNVLSFTKTGLTNNAAYFFKLKALAGTLVLAQSNEASATTTTAAPPIRGGPPLMRAKVIFQGKAYLDSLVTILKDAKVVATVRTDSKADFRAEIANLTTGSYAFGLWAEDSEGRKSVTISFTINVSPRKTTTISDILLPPTIELEKNSLEKGEFLNISGQTAPGSEIDILIDSAEQEIVEKTKAEADGKWSYSFDTSILNKGVYSVKVKATSPEGLISSFSETLIFYYIEEAPVEEICPRGDLNQDGRVNLVDFSILLYWWGRVNACADQNGNEIVDLPDFSIMMYYWTG